MAAVPGLDCRGRRGSRRPRRRASEVRSGGAGIRFQTRCNEAARRVDPVKGTGAKGIRPGGDAGPGSSATQRAGAAPGRWAGVRGKQQLLGGRFGLLEGRARLRVWPAAVFYLVATRCFIYFKAYCQYLKKQGFFF